MIVMAQNSDFFEVLIFIVIIVITLIVRGIKAANDRAQRQRQDENEAVRGTVVAPQTARSWQHWQPEGQGVEIQWGEVGRETQPTTRTNQAEVQGKSRYQQEMEEFTGRQSRVREATFASSAKDEAPVDEQPAPASLQDAVTAMEKAMATAFPKARRMARGHPQGQDRKVVLKLHGGRQLQRAVLVKEVLGQPRAFDL